MKFENFKRDLESHYDFNVQAAFKAVDDWGYKYLDERNIKRFLRTMSHVASKAEVVAIIRRFDLDGDCKVALEELADGLLSYHKIKLGGKKPKKKTQLQKQLFKPDQTLTAVKTSQKKKRSIGDISYYTPSKQDQSLAYKSNNSRAKSAQKLRISGKFTQSTRATSG